LIFVLWLTRLVAAPFLYKLGECSDVLRQKNWIVQQFLMTLVAICGRFAFLPKWTISENTFSFGTTPVRGSSEETFGYEMVFGSVGATSNGGRCVFSRAMEVAAAD